MSHTTYIAGIPHRKPDLSVLKVGMQVQLEPEPTNRFDPNAVMVKCNGVHLGYIPKMETSLVVGVPSMFIVNIDPLRKWKEVFISMDDPCPQAKDGGVA